MTHTRTQYGITVTSCFTDPPSAPSLLCRAPQLPAPPGCRWGGLSISQDPVPQPWEAKQEPAAYVEGGNWRARRGRSDPKWPQQGAPSLIPAARGFRAGAGRSWHRCTELQPHRHTHPKKKKGIEEQGNPLRDRLRGHHGLQLRTSVRYGVAVGPLCLLALSRAGWHGIVPSTEACQQDCFVAFFSPKTHKKIPFKSVETLLCFGMRRNRHALLGEVSTRAGGKGLGAGCGCRKERENGLCFMRQVLEPPASEIPVQHRWDHVQKSISPSPKAASSATKVR